jgi:hypothetical protein
MIIGVGDVQHKGIALSLHLLKQKDLDEFLCSNDVPRAVVTIGLNDEVTFRRNRQVMGHMEPPELDKEAKDSFVMAVRYATWIATGWRAQPTLLGIEMLDPEPGPPLPPPQGGSLFGATTLLLLKEAERVSPPGSWVDSLAESIEGTQLHRVAVSAAFDPCTGNFRKVDCLEDKLAALSRLKSPPAALVLAEKQDKVGDEGLLPFHMVRSSGPSQAFRKLFELQARDVLGRFLQ